MGKELFFIIGLKPGAILWTIISGTTEHYGEVQRWYHGEMRKKNRAYTEIKIAKTVKESTDGTN